MDQQQQTSEQNKKPSAPPKDPEQLKTWLKDYTGVTIAEGMVCQNHVSPWTYFQKIYLKERPPLALVLGPRGGGKSFLAALGTHLTSRWNPKHGTRILGGSKAQSEQVYRALREAVYFGSGTAGSDAASIAKLFKDQALYRNGSEVAILAASSTSVRGPHVPTLLLDEVDEIDTDIREAAMGMCMARHGVSASAIMTSTCHRVNGPMAQLIEQSLSGDFPLYTFCSFEVLERCSPERSGPRVGGDALFENCPKCPLKKWCHSERDRNGDKALAKFSEGHYAIDSLIQKVRSTSARTFEADYLCKGPKSEGAWFRDFNPAASVVDGGEYHPALPVYIAVDSGVHTGAVFFQIATEPTPTGLVEEVHVFADYFSEGQSAEQNARTIVELARTHCEGRWDSIYTDPTGSSRTGIGVTVIAELERSGLRPLRHWPRGKKVVDGLALVESFLLPADGGSRLLIHPRCGHLVEAMKCYRRVKQDGQWMDDPKDPQHPFEDLMDALRGGLCARYPNGRVTIPTMNRVKARKVF